VVEPVVRADGPTSVELGRLENSLGYRLRVAQLRIFGAFSEVASAHELTPSQFAVLLLIEANPGIKQIELAEVLDLDRSSVLRLVDRCEAAKLVRRGSSKADRRIAPPVLTARGRALLEKLEPVVARKEAAASGLTRAERSTLARLLKRIATAPGDRT
jgi:DNA-binding MarR family transcriptional regulator